MPAKERALLTARAISKSSRSRNPGRQLRVGIDTGGTFTDCVIMRASGVEIVKVFSDSQDIARSALDGVAGLLGDRMPHAPAIIHGTTVATNTLLERRGARVALVTTAGFEDLIEIGRQNRAQLYNMEIHRDPPLVPRSLRWGVGERTLTDGTILQIPPPDDLQRLEAAIRDSGIQSVAICLLFSYANPSNEIMIARALKSTGASVSVSHEILSEFREYERLSATVINAYLAPRMSRYLFELERESRRRFTVPSTKSTRAPRRATPLYVMQSSGGVTSAKVAAREPVRTILSGPAGGVVATSWLARLLGLKKVISFDMGGTSTDVCLIDGAPGISRETSFAGLPLAISMLDIHTVGAGGGSVARIDAGGALRVGPESAGASPGPISYGRGGKHPTITDAHVLLGRLQSDLFLGGKYGLDLPSVESSFRQFSSGAETASRRGPSSFRAVRELADGILRVGNATMEKALRVISVERGHDPREFSLVCFGGAGGLHAADLACSLDLAQVIVPSHPGAFSALGVLFSDIVKDSSRSALIPVPETGSTSFRRFSRVLQRRFDQLERRARAELRRDGFTLARPRVERRVDLRYRGQSFEIPLPYTPRFASAFHRAHEHAYGYADTSRPLEVVNISVRIIIPTPKPRIRRHGLHPRAHSRNAIVKTSPVWFGKRLHQTPFYQRDRLPAGVRIAGPAVVAEYSSTTVIPPEFVCRVDEYLNLILKRNSP